MGLLKKIFGSNDDSRKSKNGTKFIPATKGRVIIQKPGYKPEKNQKLHRERLIEGA